MDDVQPVQASETPLEEVLEGSVAAPVPTEGEETESSEGSEEAPATE